MCQTRPKTLLLNSVVPSIHHHTWSRRRTAGFRKLKPTRLATPFIIGLHALNCLGHWLDPPAKDHGPPATHHRFETMSAAIPFESERRAMIEQQLRRRGIRDTRVLDAMFHVPRHEFVALNLVDKAYDDRPLAIGRTETISQPYMVAAMTEAARVGPGDKALEVGGGSGYQAAILAYLGAKVYAIERNPDLVEVARLRLAGLGYAVELICGDGTEGYAPAAPYQVILVTAASPPRIPQPLFDQLADGGRLVIPVGTRWHQELHQVFKRGNEFATRILDACQFVPLVGKYGWPEGQTAPEG